MLVLGLCPKAGKSSHFSVIFSPVHLRLLIGLWIYSGFHDHGHWVPAGAVAGEISEHCYHACPVVYCRLLTPMRMCTSLPPSPLLFAIILPPDTPCLWLLVLCAHRAIKANKKFNFGVRQFTHVLCVFLRSACWGHVSNGNCF